MQGTGKKMGSLVCMTAGADGNMGNLAFSTGWDTRKSGVW